MSTDVRTLNLSDNSDGMVALNNNMSTNFIENKQPPVIEPPNIVSEKNIDFKQSTMDSTPIQDVMQPEAPLEPPMMAVDPRMTQAQAQAPMMGLQQPTEAKKSTSSENPFNLTDDQFQALVVAVCTAIAISKPVQEKLANFVPQFLNDQGNRSAVGLASTGAVAAIAFFLYKRYA
jgi:hypothetical protein